MVPSPGLPIIISAASGTGKSTICRKLLQMRSDLDMSISCTTRRPRSGEKDKKHYFFLTKEDFKRKIAEHDFLEWALVHDHYYGTPRRHLESLLKKGRNVLLAIDYQGALAIKRKKPESVLIFLLPPSIESLRTRLASRQDPLQTVARRLANSRKEFLAAKNYDYIVINDDLSKAISQINCIITAESLRIERQDLSEIKALAMSREVNAEVS